MTGPALLALLGALPEIIRPATVWAGDASPTPATSGVGAPHPESLACGDTLDIELVNGDCLRGTPCEFDSDAWRVRVADNLVWRVPTSAIRSFGYPETERLIFPAAPSTDAKPTDASKAEPRIPRRIELPKPLAQGRITFHWRADPGSAFIGEFRLFHAKPVGELPASDKAAGEPATVTWILPQAGGSVAHSSSGNVIFARTPLPVEHGWHRFTWESSGRTTRVSVDDRVVAERFGTPLDIVACDWKTLDADSAGDGLGSPAASRVRGARVVRYTVPVDEPVVPMPRNVPNDSVRLHERTTLFGTVVRVSSSSVRLISSSLRGGASEGIEVPWGEIRRVERVAASGLRPAATCPATPWGIVTRLEWRGRDSRGAETRTRWRVVLPLDANDLRSDEAMGNDGSKHKAGSLAVHHPVAGSVSLPTTAVVQAEREFEGALTWLGEPSRPFGPLRADSQSWEVRFDLPLASPTRPLDAPPSAVLVCEIQGLARTVRDTARLTLPVANPPDRPLAVPQSISVDLDAGASTSASGHRDLRLTINGQSVGWFSERLPPGANVERFTAIRVPLPRSVLRDKENTLVVRLEPRGEGPAAIPVASGGQPATPPQASRPSQLKSALIEWRN
jgi:hypothetical protein